jgi:hypothetical protein
MAGILFPKGPCSKKLVVKIVPVGEHYDGRVGAEKRIDFIAEDQPSARH